jgi:hypothetical protein
MPTPVPFRRPVMVTVTATDAATGAPLSGTVRTDGARRGVTGTAFALTIPAHRVRAADDMRGT